jgi:hypothetical protein
MVQKKPCWLTGQAMVFSFSLISFLVFIMQQSLASTQNFVPVQGPVIAPQPITTPQQWVMPSAAVSSVPMQPQTFSPIPAAYVPPPATSLQTPTEAVMIPVNPSGLSLMPPGVIKIFKKALNTVKQMRTNIQLIDQKRDNIYIIFFTTDKFLDNAYPNILIKLGKLEEIFMPQKIKKGSKSK